MEEAQGAGRSLLEAMKKKHPRKRGGPGPEKKEPGRAAISGMSNVSTRGLREREEKKFQGAQASQQQFWE